MNAPHSALPSSPQPSAVGNLRIVQGLRNALNTSPLLVNGYAMVASTGITSLLGVVFWMAATHIYDQQQVGLGAALIASMTTLSYFGQMNLGTVLNRFLPAAGSGATMLIVRAYVAAGSVSGLIALCFCFGVGTFAPALNILNGSPFAMTVFVLATIIWTIFALQDSALSGLRLSVLIPFENAAYAILKVSFLVGFAFLATRSMSGIFLGWTLALVPLVLTVNVLIFRHLSVQFEKGKQEDTVDLAAVARFLGWDYAGSVFLATALGLAPLMITSIAGVEANASYHVAWTFTYSIYLVGRSMSISLLAESASFPHRLRRLAADTFCHAMLLVSAAVIFLVAAAPLVLELFGAVYVAESTPILRILMISCLPWAATTIFIAVLRAQGKTGTVAWIQLATLLIFATSIAVLLPRFGALGVAFGWLLAHSSVLFGYVILSLLHSERGTLTDHALLLATSLASLSGSLGRSAVNLKHKIFSAPEVSIDCLPGRATMVGSLDLTQYELRKMARSVSDSATLFLSRRSGGSTAREGPDHAILKCAGTLRGIASLRRNAEVLRELHSNSRLAELQDRFPEILGIDMSPGRCRVAETEIEGLNAADCLRSAHSAACVFEAVASFVGELHGRTSKIRTIDPHWVERWIDEPARIAGTLAGHGRGGGCRLEILACLKQELRNVLTGRQIALGRGHGDLSPGNILLKRRDTASDGVFLSGLIDWDNSREDAPVAVDLYHLALSIRMLRTGEELGQIVRSCILERRYDIGGAAGFELFPTQHFSAGVEDAEFHRAMLLLTWLNHVSAVWIKSERYSSNRLWAYSNVHRVLNAIAARSG